MESFCSDDMTSRSMIFRAPLVSFPAKTVNCLLLIKINFPDDHVDQITKLVQDELV